MSNEKQAEQAYATDKYLAQMLEGYEANLPQLQEQLANIEEQVASLRNAEKEVIATIEELRELLGVDGESPTPLTLVNEEKN